MRRRAAVRALLAATVGTLAAALANPVAAHAGSLSTTSGPVEVPEWLFLMTGGGVVAGSFLLTSFVTDRDLLVDFHDRGLTLPAVVDAARPAARALGVVGLAAVVATALAGPATPTANLGLLVVWVGWWAGYTATVYLVGNTWPALSPWRTIADWLPQYDRDYPADLGVWPAVAGLLGLVWLEVVSPLAGRPALLGWVVVGYTLVTLAGAAAFGSETWFGRVDPVAGVFRAYGAMAPVRRGEDGLEVGLPGGALSRSGVASVPGGAAFVVALLWVTTYDGFVSTPAWAAAARAVVGTGVPPRLLYLGALLAGFALFLGAYRGASRLARRTADAYVAPRTVQRRFAPSLLPIAAGYHLAHFLGYFLSLSPALLAALANPLGGAHATPLTLPGWFGGLQLAFVVVGHLLAVWVAHATAFDLFTGRLQPIRSQYPYILLMVAYTMTSLWIVSAPSGAPPYV